LDTYYYIKPICKKEFPKKWNQINEINFFVLVTFKELHQKHKFPMKYEHCNSRVMVHKKNVMGSLFVMELKIFPQF
jgi:hypothetical protein